MAMNFDTYSTSFQSLMKPMYNLNANYTIGMGGYPGAAGMIGGGFMNPAMMGMYAMGPMANVGVGQFRANYLLQGEDQMNNYYARPVAAHKKENETGTILGILGTALGTAALLAALAKGKFRRPVKTPGTTVPTPPVATPPTGGKPGQTPKPPVNNPPTGGQGTVLGLPAPTPKPPVNTHPTGGQGTGTVLVDPIPGPTQPVPGPQQSQQVAGYLPQYTQRMQDALNKQAAAMNLPSSGKVITTPAPSVTPAGYLPQYTSRMQDALNKQAAAMNLPSSGKVITTPAPVNAPAVTSNAITPTTITMPQRSSAPAIKYDWKSEAVDVPFEEISNKIGLPAPASASVPATTAKVNLKPIQDYYNTSNKQYNIPGGIKGFLPAQAS